MSAASRLPIRGISEAVGLCIHGWLQWHSECHAQALKRWLSSVLLGRRTGDIGLGTSPDEQAESAASVVRAAPVPTSVNSK